MVTTSLQGDWWEAHKKAEAALDAWLPERVLERKRWTLETFQRYKTSVFEMKKEVKGLKWWQFKKKKELKEDLRIQKGKAKAFGDYTEDVLVGKG